MSDPTNRIAGKRRELHEQINGLLSDGRVSEYEPGSIVRPAIFIGAPLITNRRENNSPVTYAAFPVVITVDGSKDAQLVLFDELVAKVWDAAWAVGEPTTADPGQIDLGQSTVRAQVVTVEIPILSTTLCHSQLMEAVSV